MTPLIFLRSRRSFTPLEVRPPAKGGTAADARGGLLLTGFTLIELLVVIAIVAVLSVVVIITLNPAELLKQARDSSRISDLATINSALNLFLIDNPLGTLGTVSTIYVSVPDSSPVCDNLGLPALPAGWSYHCSDAINYRKADSNGWIPVNFSSISSGSPLSILPVDPINSTSTGNYYTYMSGGSWEMTAMMESQKYQTKATADGGIDPLMYETGTNLTLSGFTHGLTGYWKLDEGIGLSAADSSGFNNMGSLVSNPAWVTGKAGKALSFNGTPGQEVSIPNLSSYTFDADTSMSVSAWVYVDPSNPPGRSADLVEHGVPGNANGTGFALTTIYFTVNDNVGTGDRNSFVLTSGQWYFLVGVYDRASNKTFMYIDGALSASISTPQGVIDDSGPLTIGFGGERGSALIGIIDDIRVYRRALSAAEISTIYNATK